MKIVNRTSLPSYNSHSLRNRCMSSCPYTSVIKNVVCFSSTTIASRKPAVGALIIELKNIADGGVLVNHVLTFILLTSVDWDAISPEQSSKNRLSLKLDTTNLGDVATQGQSLIQTLICWPLLVHFAVENKRW